MQEEADALKKRFTKVNRAKFARDFGVKGGQAAIYQHINGIRPINLDAAKAYAQGFGCSLEEISPRLAQQVASVAAVQSNNAQAVEAPSKPWPFQEWINIARIENLSREDLIFVAGKLDAAIQERENERTREKGAA